MVVLLRGVNVGGRMLPMAKLRDACRADGIEDIETYIQSGNLLFRAASAEAAAQRIGLLIERVFGWRPDVVARSATRWAEYVAAVPFEDAEDRPSQVHLGLSVRPLAPDTVERLAAKAIGGERIFASNDALWIDFSQGVGESKLAPAFINACAGSPVTLRNWRTVRRLAAMAAA